MLVSPITIIKYFSSVHRLIWEIVNLNMMLPLPVKVIPNRGGGSTLQWHPLLNPSYSESTPMKLSRKQTREDISVSRPRAQEKWGNSSKTPDKDMFRNLINLRVPN